MQEPFHVSMQCCKLSSDARSRRFRFMLEKSPVVKTNVALMLRRQSTALGPLHAARVFILDCEPNFANLYAGAVDAQSAPPPLPHSPSAMR